MDNNSLQKKCTKAWCKTLIPLNAKFKACDTCRMCDQDKKATVTTRVSTGSKCSGDDSIDGEKRLVRHYATHMVGRSSHISYT